MLANEFAAIATDRQRRGESCRRIYSPLFALDGGRRGETTEVVINFYCCGIRGVIGLFHDETLY